MEGIHAQFDFLAKVMDAADLRHKVIANNVANINTPGYRRKEVVFEQALASALHANPESVAKVQPQVVEAPGGAGRADGNTADIDGEMGRLNKNTVLYKVFGQLLAGAVGTMRSAITGK